MICDMCGIVNVDGCKMSSGWPVPMRGCSDKCELKYMNENFRSFKSDEMMIFSKFEHLGEKLAIVDIKDTIIANMIRNDKMHCHLDFILEIQDISAVFSNDEFDQLIAANLKQTVRSNDDPGLFFAGVVNSYRNITRSATTLPVKEVYWYLSAIRSIGDKLMELPGYLMPADPVNVVHSLIRLTNCHSTSKSTCRYSYRTY